MKTTVTKSQVNELLNRVEKNYEYVLIDSPAGIDEGFKTSIEGANEALVIVTPEVPSIRDADRVVGILMAKGIKKIQLIINRIRPDMVKKQDMMSVEDVTNILGIPLVGIIPDSEKVIIASNRGEPLVLDTNMSLPGQAFENITRRLLGEDVELLDLSSGTSKNPVTRILRNLINRPGSKS